MSEIATIGSGLFDLSEDMLGDIEELCLENMHMSRESLPAQWSERLDFTHGEASRLFNCKAMFKGFPIERVDGQQVRLRSGDVLESAVLAEALADAAEVAVFAVTVHGFEGACASAVNSGITLMLFGEWGSAFSMGSRRWIEGEVRNRAQAQGMDTGKTLFPGEDGLEMSLQNAVAGLIDLEEIGLEVKVDYIMHPTMSITGFIPVLAKSK